ncbi:MAG: Nif3-like dinuclear metal center hexameric protein [Candidatus Nanopelagicales bacterium]|nr:Nif3-like dinuclear metal center hexameric protein [Candidatus Nanopelagicales bacterium]
MPATVGQIAALLEKRYPPALAADWDAVGLVCGDPQATVTRVLFAVDPVRDVVDEALMLQADMIVTHHPLLLRGVHSVAAVNHKGSVLHTLISHGISLFAAHTNADHARPGVSDALAAALGIVDPEPLVPEPYDPSVGTGRVGRLDETLTFGAFVDRVAERLPATVQGIRASGDPNRLVESIAGSGGSGAAFLGEAGALADVYVTSDLRHHRAQDHLVDGGCALIDVAHWASEWPWLPVAAQTLRHDAEADGTTVEVHVSTIVTDPWTLHRGSQP